MDLFRAIIVWPRFHARTGKPITPHVAKWLVHATSETEAREMVEAAYKGRQGGADLHSVTVTKEAANLIRLG